MPEIALTVAQVLWEERIALERTRPSSAPVGTTSINRHHKNIAEPPQQFAGEKNASEEVAKSDVDESTENQPKSLAEIYRRLNEDNHWALCLSGGGIRSAAFALGILQRFAAQPIAPK